MKTAGNKRGGVAKAAAVKASATRTNMMNNTARADATKETMAQAESAKNNHAQPVKTSTAKTNSSHTNAAKAKVPKASVTPRVRISETPIPLPVIPRLLPPPPPPPQPVQHSQPQKEQERSAPTQDSSTSIGAAVKSHPRRRKRKEIYEGPIVRPTPPKPRRAVPQPIPISSTMPPPRSTKISQESPGFTGSSHLSPGEVITLAPIRPGSESSTPGIQCLEPNPIVSPPSPLAYSATAPSRPYPTYPYPSHPMLYSDPLVRLRYGGEQRYSKTGERQLAAKDPTPSPSDQLQREHLEAAASLMCLGTAS